MKEEELTRCFIAIDLPREIINSLKETQKLLKKQNLFNGNFTEPENFHLTLKFLGEIDSEKAEEVKKKLHEIKFNEFNVTLGEPGFFSSKYSGEIKVIWVKLKGKFLFELQKEINDKLNGLFEKEDKFMSHINLVKIKNTGNKKQLLDYLRKVRIPKMSFKVDKFYLKKSELFETGPIYSDIDGYELIKEKYSLES
ncbi:MAG: RNA 2',3'-cyclic phosphodiesterase [Candidatus Pacearchaeota archaeon]|jgi:2'-5' RNA ligase